MLFLTLKFWNVLTVECTVILVFVWPLQSILYIGKEHHVFLILTDMSSYAGSCPLVRDQLRLNLWNSFSMTLDMEYSSFLTVIERALFLHGISKYWKLFVCRIFPCQCGIFTITQSAVRQTNWIDHVKVLNSCIECMHMYCACEQPCSLVRVNMEYSSIRQVAVILEWQKDTCDVPPEVHFLFFWNSVQIWVKSRFRCIKWSACCLCFLWRSKYVQISALCTGSVCWSKTCCVLLHACIGSMMRALRTFTIAYKSEVI